MAGIARRVELYNQSFQLAREHVAKDTALNARADIVKQLHDAIRRELNSGSDDVVAIAASAVRALQQQYQDPQRSSGPGVRFNDDDRA